jgi:hypothetical protein
MDYTKPLWALPITSGTNDLSQRTSISEAYFDRSFTLFLGGELEANRLFYTLQGR